MQPTLHSVLCTTPAGESYSCNFTHDDDPAIVIVIYYSYSYILYIVIVVTSHMMMTPARVIW